MMKSLTYILLLLLLIGVGNQEAWARKKKKTTAGTAKVEQTPYQKLFQGKQVTTSKGLMTVHMIEGKAYVEFPLSLLERDLLYTTSIQSISDNGEGIVGQFSDDVCVCRFTKEDSLICARLAIVNEPVNNSGDSKLSVAIGKSSMPGIFSSFKIEAYTPDSSAVVIEMSKFFVEHIAYASPFPGMAGNSMLGFVHRVHKIDPTQSRLGGMTASPSTVTAICELLYKVDYYMLGNLNRRDVPVNLTVNKMLSVLPEKPMAVRFADPRIGVSFVQKSGIPGKFEGMKSMYYARRWRLEPSDNEAYARGEMVEPKKPIVLYMDTLIPQGWQPYVKMGAEAWNAAFEKIGFKNVIQVKEFPKNDPKFDANDIANSVIRFSPSWMYDVQNSLTVDPRTGEILNASIYIHHNSIGVLQRERILATMASDPAVRRVQLTDEQIGRLIQANMMQYMGLNLGLIPNFAASSAYPVDSLRSASFTRQYGLAASVLDHLRYNFVAQPEDVERGVLLEPTVLGPYDYYAIRWLYQPIAGIQSPREETPVLDGWINEKSGDPRYRYSLMQYPIFAFDPSVVSGDLGDDPIKSMEYYKKNLKRYAENFYEWYAEDDRDLSFRTLLLGRIGFLYNGKLGNVINQIGGIYMNDVKVGDGKSAYQVVPKKKQKEVVKYVIAQAKDIDWLYSPEVSEKLEIGTDIRVTRTAIIGALLGRISRLAVCVEKDPDAYSPEELIDDVYREVWKSTIAGRQLTKEEILLQQGLLGSIAVTSQAGSPAGTFETPKAITSDGNFPCKSPEDVMASLKYADLLEILPFSEGVEVMNKYGFYPMEWPGIQANRYSSAALFYDMLLKTRNLIQGALGSARGETKKHYEFMLYKINKMLANK